MSQMCPNCSFDNPDQAQTCNSCRFPLRGLLGYHTILSNRYQVASVLGYGAMGAVYLAEHTRLQGRRYAIKENRPNPETSLEFQAHTRQQFLAEASVLALLDHPGLPKVSDYFVENNYEYLVMEYIEGEDLESRVQRTGQPLPEAEVLAWADQVLDALTYLHNQQPKPIIHRDIKPSNIRVTPQGKVKLVDFGLVKLLDSDNPQTKAEMRGVGTPEFAPLEQFSRSYEHTDTRSDIYSLGATMYRLLTNLFPVQATQRVLEPHLLDLPRQLNPNLSENTERVVLRALEIHPIQRFQSAEEMQQALREPATLPASTASSTAKFAKTQRAAAPVSAWLFGIVGLMLVLLILGGVSYLLFGLGETSEAIAQPPAIIQGQPTATPTELIVQTLGDAPTDTPTPVVPAAEVTEEITPTETASPTLAPTATPAPTVKATTSQVITASALVGTIAYPVFNGTDFDIYFGQADGSGNRLYRRNASQPAFSPDGSRIAFHSWRLDSWGLSTMDISGVNQIIVANFVEDQLPTWSADGRDIILLSRRAGDRKSRLIRVGSSQDRTEGAVIGEGEYPTIGLSGRLVFKGWGSTAPGLRSATTTLADIQIVTNVEDDTAPAPSPDGQKIAFMSRRDGNWEIYMVNADSSGVQRLTNDPAEDGLPTWSPDGKALAFVSRRGGSWGMWAMAPNGSSQRLLFALEGSPDGFVGRDVNTSRGWLEERISWTR